MGNGTILLRLYRDDRGGYFTQVVQWPDDVRFEPVPLDPELVQGAIDHFQRLRERERLLGPLDEVYQLGSLLRQLMLPTPLLRALLLLLAERRRLKLCWQVDAPELVSLPWECVYLDPRTLRELRRDPEFAERCHEFLKAQGGPFFPFLPRAGLRLPFFRLSSVQAPSPARLQPLGKLRLLLAVADPRGDLHPNAPAVLQPLQELGRRVEVDLLPHAKRAELEARLAEAEPYHALVFYGHGEHRGPGESFLLLEAEAGAGAEAREPELLAAEELAHWLTIKSRQPIALAVLIACESGVELAHRLVEAGVPAVVALQGAITEAEARDFCEYFFRELARGSPLEECLATGRQALSRRLGEYVDRFEWALPVLVASSPETTLFEPADPLAHIPFAGREREFERLVGELEAAQAGRGRAVFLAGEAGVGKTRLAQELIGHARLRYPTLVLEGKGQELQQLTAFYPVAEAIREGLRRVSAQDLNEIAELWLAEVAEVVPELRDLRPGLPRNPELPPQQARLRRFEGLTQFFLGLTQIQDRRPVVLFLDDLQWADSLTLEFLSYFLPRIEEQPILVIGAYRSEEVGKEHPLRSLLQAGRRQGRLTLFELSRLSREAVVALIKGLAPTLPKGEAFARRLYEETAGNPFFMVAVLRNFLEAGLIRVKGKDWIPRVEDLTANYKELMIPREVKEVILRRVERLTEGERRLLRLAAVLGQEFEYEPLHRAWEGDGEALELLEALLEKQLVVERPGPEERYGFSHDKIREVVYEGISLPRRRLLHGRVVKALEGVYAAQLEGRAAVLAQHAYRAGEWKKALEYAVQALKKAVEGYHHREGLELAELGWEAAEKLEAAGEDKAWVDAQRFELLAQRVEIFNLQGRREEQGQDLAQMEELAERLGEKSKLASVFQKRSELHYRMGKYAEAEEAARKALELYRAIQDREIRDRRVQGACLNIIGNIYSHLSRYDEALDYYRQVLKLSREISDRQSQGISLNNIGTVYYYLSRYDEALDYYRQALEIYREIGDRRSQGLCLDNIGNVYGSLGRYDEELSYHRQALKLSCEIGDRWGQGSCLNNIGNVYYDLSRYDEALSHFQQALEIRREIGDKRGQGVSLGSIGNVHRKLGQPTEALKHYQEARAIFEELGAKAKLLEYLSEEGMAHLELKEKDKALACSAQAIRMLEGGQACENPQEVYFNHYKILAAHGREEEALKYLQKAYDKVMQRAEKITNPEFRESFLQNVPTNREIVEEWEKHQENPPSREGG